MQILKLMVMVAGLRMRGYAWDGSEKSGPGTATLHQPFPTSYADKGKSNLPASAPSNPPAPYEAGAAQAVWTPVKPQPFGLPAS
jgi:hypothetical protein